MKSLDELTYSELRQFMLANRCTTIEEAIDIYAREAARELDVEINPIVLAVAVGADVEVLEEEKRLKDLVTSLRESIPSDIIEELKSRTGPRGVRTFIVKVQKLFLDIVSNPAWIKYEQTDITGRASDSVMQEIIEVTATQVLANDKFDMFEGTVALDDQVLLKAAQSRQEIEEFMNSLRRD
jgi:hypothetical protein